MSYKREVPRDFFNEALLLKCWGRLAVWHVDEFLPNDTFYMNQVDPRNRAWKADPHQASDFLVDMDVGSGDIYLRNWKLSWRYAPSDVQEIRLFVPRAQEATAKNSWPMKFHFSIPDDDIDVEGEVFTPDGHMHEDFRKEFGLRK